MSDLLLLFSALTVALLGSGHCFAMCGAIASLPGKDRYRSYQLGRAVGYAGLGALFGGLGKGFFHILNQSPEIEVIGFLFLCCVLFLQAMLVLAGSFDNLFISQFFRHIHSILFAPLSRYLMRGRGSFLFGVGNALLPCGFFIYFGSLAAVAGTPLKGAAFFLMLWLGSLPALLAATYSLNELRQFIRNRKMGRVFISALFFVGIYSLIIRVDHAKLLPGDSVHIDALPFCGIQ